MIPFHTCWEWLGTTSWNGYGRFRINKSDEKIGAHQAAWQLTNGLIPKGMCVLHKCDNRTCVNPAHLFLGPHKQNTQDMINKKRGHPNWGNPLCMRGHIKMKNAKDKLVCRECEKISSHKSWLKKKEQGN